MSFPAKWSEETRSFMLKAAADAGFPEVSGMDEPTAALYATLTQNMNDAGTRGLLRTREPGYMLLIDMGADTTDLAVCRYTVASDSGLIRAEDIKNEIVITWPESAGAPTFGGREVDRVLKDYHRQPFPPIDRAKLEGMLSRQLEDFRTLILGCLDHAVALEPAIDKKGVDLAVLTGGHSAWYFTQALLEGSMPGLTHPALRRVQAEKDRVMRLSNPQETVALGLVYSLLPMRVEAGRKPAARALQWPFVSEDSLVALAAVFMPLRLGGAETEAADGDSLYERLLLSDGAEWCPPGARCFDISKNVVSPAKNKIMFRKTAFTCIIDTIKRTNETLSHMKFDL